MSELTLRNPQLEGIDPFSSELTREQQKQIAEEARINPAFFFPIVDKATIKGNSIPSYFFKQMIKPCLCCGALGELKESESGDKISNQVQCTNMGCMLNNYNTWYCNEWDAIKEWYKERITENPIKKYFI